MDLSDIREAQAEWAKALVRERNARVVLSLMVVEARERGAKLADIGAELGCSRQYVYKVLREARKEADAREAEAAYFNAQARKDEREQLRGLGFTTRDRQCGVCTRLKSRPSSVCDYCGDDPVGNTTNGDPTAVDRMNFDAAHSGGIR